ncbi:amino acid adenylation domain-containing protein [Streptomyces sp. NPDC002685]|uniref:amino acid adenylation domain-containing protein n=1 Tax=Streptomyces sp. NPDC002685 TaxID=3154540 RepID=UPI003327649B
MSVDDTPNAQQDTAALREELLRRRLAGARGHRRTAIERVDRSGPLPLSFGQQQMWFLNRLDPDSHEYLVPLVLRLRGTLDTDALRGAWQRVLERHEILRTRYAPTEGDPVQLVDPAGDTELPVVDVTGSLSQAGTDAEAAAPTGADSAGREARVRRLVEEEIDRPIDVERQWPVRAKLFRLDAHDHVLAVTFHHIACDAWSVRIFAGELSALYTAAVTGTPAALPDLPLQYADFASWQRRHLTGDTLERQLAYWRSQLDGIQPLDTPIDRPRPAVRDWAGDSVPFRIPAATADRARALARRYDTTLFNVLLAAYQALLARHTAAPGSLPGAGADIPVGITVSGRGRPELQHLFGYGINTLVARARWDGDPSFGQVLTQVRDMVLNAFDHQSVPFARLVDELQPDRDLARTPLFQVDFILHEDRGSAFDMPGLSVESVMADRVAKFDLTLNVDHAETGGLDARLAYPTALFERATVARTAERFIRLLDAATARPDAPLSGADLLTDDDRALLARPYTTAELPEPLRDCLVEEGLIGPEAATAGTGLPVRVVDAHGRPLPVGVAGELCVGAVAGAQAPASFEGSLPDPSGPSGALLHRTGRLARWLADGTLDLLGLIEEQVCVRGRRVDLGQIRSALTSFAGVREALVVVRDSGAEPSGLAAYTVATGPDALDTAGLRAHLAERLPEPLVPDSFTVLAALPVTAEGVPDLDALPDPRAAADGAAARTAPRTPAEERLVALWREVLGVDEVGVDDNFFALGGDSLRAVRLAGAMRAAGFDVTIRGVFQHGTISRLAAAVEWQEGTATQTGLVRAVEPFALLEPQDQERIPEGVVDAYPLSQIQTGMLVETLTRPGQGAYVNISSFRVPDDEAFDPAALRAALDMVAARHDVLRTSVALDGYSRPLQLVHGQVELPLDVHDLRGLDEEQRRAEAAAFTAERRSGFDLRAASLVRVDVHLESDDTWRLTFTQSHAVSDGWSQHTLLMELLGVYRAVRDGQPLPAHETPSVRYADFVAAELASLDGDADHEFWQRVTDEHAPFALPGAWGEDGPVEGYRVAVPFHDLQHGLRRLAAAADGSLKSVLLAAHLTVLSQLTSERSFHSGLVVHGRLEAPGGDRILGMHLNTVPFPVVRAATWRELVRRTFAQETRVWGHRRHPLPAIQRAADSTDRLITVLFEYQDFHQVDDALVADRDGANGIGDTGGAVNEFALNVLANSGHIHLISATDVLGRADSERLADMYRQVLTAMAADPDGDATATHLPAGERHQLLAQWHTTPGQLPVLPVHHLFEDQAAETPHSPAVRHLDSLLSYAELDERANRIAHHLRTLGAGPDTLVGLHLARGPELLPAMLGIWKSGAGCLPLDPSLQRTRMATMLEDAGPRLIVTTGDLLPALAGLHDRDTVVLDRAADARAIAARPATRPEPVGTLANLAYVMYTSGSTGTPKGVLVPHSGLANYLGWSAEAYASRGSGGAPVFSSISFDLGLPDLLTPLITGQTTHLLPQDLSTADLGAELAAGAPYSFIKLTPGHLDLLTHQLTAEQAHGLAGLVIAAGDSFSAALVARWRELAGPQGTALAAEYGPTETSIGNSGSPVADTVTTELVPLGAPVPNTSMYVLDERMRPVPVGVPGEVYIGGIGLARGYQRRPGLTAERFLPDPYGPPGSRLYRTGDLARYLADGTLDFLGRIDNQVKIRGYRVELGEVQHHLTAHPDVEDAVLLLRENGNGEKSLVAYVVGTSTPGQDAADLAGLRAHLSARLPEYMVPAAFMAVDRIPLTANGKVDRRALPAPDREAFAGTAHIAPRTPVEERIAAVWREVLGVDRVGAEDGFFALGGDSMRAVRLAGALREAGFDLSIGDVFEHGTVAALAVAAAGKDGTDSLVRAVEPFAQLAPEDRERLPEGVVDAYPLSQIQTGMLVEMLTHRDRNTYHHVNNFRIRDREPFSLLALREALAVVTARHDILRTSMALEGYSQPLQLVHSHADIALAVHDLRGLGEERQRAAALAFIAEEKANLFDLHVAPLFRVSVHLESDEAWRLTFTQSHAITEGWSYHTLLMELLAAYRAVRDGQPLPAYETPSVRYADFIAAETEALASEEQRAFWQAVVDTSVPFTLPEGWGQEGPSEPYHRLVPFHDLEEGLRRLAAAAGGSLKSVLLAAHLTVLSRLTPERAFHSGLVAHGRLEAPGGDRVLGMHLNTVPFPAVGGTTWRELVRRTFTQETRIWGHRRYPLPAIQRAADSADRLITVLFSYLDFHQVDTDAVDVEAGFGVGGNEFALDVIAARGHLSLGSFTDVMSRDNAERLADMYRQVLTAMAENPDGDAAIALLPAQERHLLFGEWNATDVEWPTGSVLDLFEETAARVPEAVAVVAGERRLSYRELDERANRIAHHLRSLGAGPDTLVGVCLNRGPELVAALLGVWKAGAAYVPLDPSNPAERLAHVLTDSEATVLVTDSASAHATEGHRGPRLDLDADRAVLAAAPATPPARECDPGLLAYVIYTSGSTGTPKGVMITQRGLANHLRWAARDLTGDEGGAPLFSSVAFDLPATNLYVPLITGRSVHILPADLDTASLGEALAGGAPYGFIKLTPGHLEVLTHQLPPGELARLAGTVLVAGEALPPRLANHWLGLVGPGRLVNEYGPTETSIGATAHPVTGAQNSAVPLGGPLPNTTAYVLDARLRPVPVGVPGELHIGGEGLARGYRNCPGLTAERFVPDPYGPPGSRLYRTGDLARHLPDGTLDFLGRIDNQVKIRGYRVELGEVQHRLTEYPGVKDAAVVVHQTADRGPELAAYVVASDGLAPDRTALRAHLAATLPDYMVPVVFTPVESIPLTPNGKLDRRALPAPDQDSRPYVAPTTPTEQAIAAVWREVLGLERVGADDSFFDLGGHSILAVRMLATGREAGLPLAVWMIYQAGTLAELAELVDAEQGPDGAVGGAGAGAGSDGTRVPRLPAQARADAGTGAHRSVGLTLRRPDPALLEQALAAVVAHHEALRLRLTPGSSEGLIAPAESARLLEVVDLRGTAVADRADAVARALDAARDRLDPASGPVLQATLCDVGEERLLASDVASEMWITVHELAADAASLALVAEDVETAYRMCAQGSPVRLPSVPTPLRQWASRTAELAARPETADQAHQWIGQERAGGLPVDHPGGDNSHGSARTVTAVLSPERTRALLAGYEPEQALLTTLGRVVTRWTGRDRLTLDLRTDPRDGSAAGTDLSRTVGPLADSVPLTLWLPRTRELPALLRSVGRQLAELPVPRHVYGVLRDLAPDPELAAELRSAERPRLGFALLAAPSAQTNPGAERDHLLDVAAVFDEGQLYLRWTYGSRLYDAATVQRLADEHLVELNALTALATTPSPADEGGTGGTSDAAARATRTTRATHRVATRSVPEVMARHHIPGAAIALIEGGELASVETHGHLGADGEEPVGENTLFAAASISKHVTTFGLLRLAQEQGLDLDLDVNRCLSSWQLPAPDAGDAPPVTLRHLVANLAGLAEPPRRAGYRIGEPVPSVLDLLHGRSPAEPVPVGREFAPGEVFRLNNAHYCVLQQAMTDLSGEPFPELMRRLVLEPLGMEHSGFDPAFPETSGLPVARGHGLEGVPLPGGHEVYPESAARGLWTTAGDLARLVLGVRDSRLGRPGALVPQEAVREMLTPQSDRPYGWGTIVDHSGVDLEFGHGGQAAGYQAMFGMRAHAGSGAVVLTNAASGRELVTHLMSTGWSDKGRLTGFWQSAAAETAVQPR